MKRSAKSLHPFQLGARLYLVPAIVLSLLAGPCRLNAQTSSASAAAAGNSLSETEAPKATSTDTPPPAKPPAAPQASAATALTAFPAKQLNKVLPKWLRFGGEYRMRTEYHTAYSFIPNDNDGFLLSRLKLNAEVTPTSWMSGFVQGKDSRPIGIQPSHITTSIEDRFNLYQAYLQLQNSEGSWIRLRLGRQELRYGAERFIGVSDWTNAPRVFDGVRLIVGPAKDHVDIFSTSVVVNNADAFDRSEGGLHFDGIYGTLTTLVPKASVEPFLFLKDLPAIKSIEGTPGDEYEWTYGFRFTGKLPLNFDYTVETAKQSGNYSTDSIQAWAGYENVGYTLPKLPLKPRFLVQYDYASGENNPKGGGVMGRFDQLYPSNHDVFGLVDLLGWENITQMRAGVGLQPINRLAVNFDFRSLSVANRRDSLYGSTGSVLVKAPSTGALSREVGQEPDLLAKYDIRYNVTAGTGYGYLISGPFLTQNTKKGNASIAYIFGTYKF